MSSKTGKHKQPSPFFPTEEERMAERARLLNRDDVTNQARLLLNDFIHDRMVRDGIIDAPEMDQLLEPNTPIGPPMNHTREISRALRCIGDELDRDQKLQELIQKIPPEAETQTFWNVANKIFSDGIFNWGRVTALFYFAYKVCVKALDRIPLMRAIINLIVDFFRERVAAWIIERGGWEAAREYFGSTWKQWALVTGAGAAAAVAIFVVKSWH